MPPPTPHNVSGTARKGPFEGYVLISTTVSSGGGQTVDIAVNDGTELAASQTVTLTHVSSDETLTVNTNAAGEYQLELANLPSYSVGDAITLSIDTRTVTTELAEQKHIGANAYKQVLVDKTGKEYDKEYPFSTRRADQLDGHPQVTGNVQTDWTITRGDGQPDSETVTYPNGYQYKRTFSYDSSNRMTSRSRWVKQ